MLGVLGIPLSKHVAQTLNERSERAPAPLPLCGPAIPMRWSRLRALQGNLTL